MVQRNKTGQMFKCEMRSIIVNKEGVKILLLKAPKGVMSTLVDFVGNEVMVTFEDPQRNLDFSEDKTSK